MGDGGAYRHYQHNRTGSLLSVNLILQAALGVQTEIFYAYDNANSSLYNTSTGKLTPAGVAYQVTEQWLIGATERPDIN